MMLRILFLDIEEDFLLLMKDSKLFYIACIL